jgi:dUTP pyrophosphatase
MDVKLVLGEGVNAPSYATDGAAGFDLVANNFKSVYIGKTKIDAARYVNAFAKLVLEPGYRVLVGIGFSVEVPLGYEFQVRPRSGSALKEGITVLNSPGTIDSDYRGEVGVILINHSNENVYIGLGDRIAQGVIAPYIKANFVTTDSLSDTARGTGGLGHTGK